MGYVFVKRQKPSVESDSELDPGSYSLQEFFLYETQTRFYLFGKDEQGTRWRVLKIDRSEKDLKIQEDPAIYTEEDYHDLRNRLAEGNRRCGGLSLVTKAYGIIGFVKFLEPYYMILITKHRFLGSIQGHSIYGICGTRLVTIPHSSILTDLAFSKAEKRYVRLFNSIDLSKDFFYSYTYRIMWTLQRNSIADKTQKVPYDDMFVWNSFLTRPFRTLLNTSHWTVPLVHGFFRQEKIFMENSSFILTLIARRSRHYAGTRYLKRGINAKGRVANDVETEQLISDVETDHISSIVQHRGSVPLYWSQETSVYSIKPDIILHKKDSEYKATSLHFQNLAARYGNPIVILNLVRSVERKPRESVLCREFATAVAYLNHKLHKTDRITFIQLDLRFFSRRRKESIDMLEILENVAGKVLDSVGFYYSGNVSGEPAQTDSKLLQHGVLRTNCIDCLDRTNVAQYAFGLAALGRQMRALGLSKDIEPCSSSNVGIILMEFYENMGDTLALQYGGSAAHNKLFLQWQGKWKATIRTQEFFRALMRHYSNTYLDGEKQDAINIFLGNFCPGVGRPNLWEMDSDNHLQFRRSGDDPENDLRLSFKRSLSTVNLPEKIDDSAVVSKPVPVSELDSSSSQKLRSVNKSFNMGKRSITVSEAELKEYVIEQVNNNSNSSTKTLSHCIDSDWMPESTKSCNADELERNVLAVTGLHNRQNNNIVTGAKTDEWQWFLSEILKIAEDSDEQDDYFRDLTTLLVNAKTKKYKQDENMHSSHQEVNSSHQGEVNGSVNSVEMTSNNGVFSKTFEHWVQEGEILCF